jgi:hypothetical protein
MSAESIVSVEPLLAAPILNLYIPETVKLIALGSGEFSTVKDIIAVSSQFSEVSSRVAYTEITKSSVGLPVKFPST